MQFQVEELSPVEKKVAVEIPWELVRQKLDAAYRELGKDAQIRGFRPGKVPRSVLERMFGKKVHEEVAKNLVQESFLRAAQEHEIEPVADPVVEDAAIRAGESFRYSARVEVRGKVELKDVNLSATRTVHKVSDDDVAKALEHKRSLHTEYRTIEGRTETTGRDVVVVAMKGNLGEYPVDRTVTVDLGDSETETLPGLLGALTGIPLAAQDHLIELTIPADAPQKELAGKTATLRVTIKEAREKVVPDLDDEFAKDTGEAESLDELSTKTRAELETQSASQTNDEVRQGVLKDLVAKNPVPLAPALIERGIDSQMERLRMSLAMQGVDMKRAGVNLESMRERMREAAADEIRGQMLLDAIADKEGVELAEADVEAKIAELAALKEKPAHKYKRELERDGTLETLKWRMRQEKTLDILVGRATITAAEIEEP